MFSSELHNYLKREINFNDIKVADSYVCLCVCVCVWVNVRVLRVYVSARFYIRRGFTANGLLIKQLPLIIQIAHKATAKYSVLANIFHEFV